MTADGRRVGYLSKEVDWESFPNDEHRHGALSDLSARKYQPSKGAFVTQDQLWMLGSHYGAAHYSYHDPVNFSDPSGYDPRLATPLEPGEQEKPLPDGWSMGPDPVFLAATIHSHANVFLYGRLPLPGFSAPSYKDLNEYFSGDPMPDMPWSMAADEFTPVNEDKRRQLPKSIKVPWANLPVKDWRAQFVLDYFLWIAQGRVHEVANEVFGIYEGQEITEYLQGGPNVTEVPVGTPGTKQHHIFPV